MQKYFIETKFYLEDIVLLNKGKRTLRKTRIKRRECNKRPKVWSFSLIVNLFVERINYLNTNFAKSSTWISISKKKAGK